jgi:hypothetical protein
MNVNPQQRQGGIRPSLEVIKKMEELKPKQSLEYIEFLIDLEHNKPDEYVKAKKYIARQKFDALPLHKQVGKVIGDNVAKVGQWFKEQMPERKPKESVDYGPVDIGDL